MDRKANEDQTVHQGSRQRMKQGKIDDDDGTVGGPSDE